jgi:hypothetical protein
MDVAKRYVRLAHAINTHAEGFIDSYVGPEAWREAIAHDLDGLENECSRLEDEIAALIDPSRQAFLRAQARAMRTMIRFKRGDEMSFADEVRGLYDIELEHTPEHVLDEAIQQLDDLLPGTGSISERWEQQVAPFRVPVEHLPRLLEAVNEEMRTRTKHLFELPKEESVNLELVREKPWAGYNWYLGNAQSRVDVNLDFHVTLFKLLDLIAHECYPGHHTERIFKNRLYEERGYAEYTVQLLNAPEAVLAEGIATNALEFITEPDEISTWMVELAEIAGLSITLDDVQHFLKAQEVYEVLGEARRNACIMKHQDGASDETIITYLRRYWLASPARAAKSLEFINYARGYMFTYSMGYQLLQDALARGNRQAVFKHLLAEPMTPGQLRDFAPPI